MTVPAAPPLARPADATTSYWSVVWAQLRKNRVAMFALACARLLLLVAIGAPVLAFNVPFVLKASDAWSAPFLDRLFDRFVFPGGVDVFFNLLLLALPIWWGAARLGRGLRPGDEAIRGPGFVFGAIVLGLALGYVLFGALTGASLVTRLFLTVVVPGALLQGFASSRSRLTRGVAAARARWSSTLLFLIGFGLLMGPWKDTSPLVDYRAKVRTLEASGEGFAVFPVIPFHPDNVGELGSSTTGRSLRKPGGENVLGCDLNGRDVGARLLFGTRISMTIGLVAVSIFIAIGVLLGSLAGYYQGWIDLAIMRLVEVMICFPTLFLLLTIIAIFESRSIFLIMGVIGLVGWPGVSRLVRGEFLRQRNLDYVTAAKSQGIPERLIIFGHVLPNCMGPVLVSATFGIASSILTESSLAFLGLGDTTAASWGQMLNAGRSEGQWHLIFAPGLAIFFVVTTFNLLGEGLRDALDPKLRR